MPSVTVIVPVYNVKQYLARCIDSILHQSYSDLEILLIDDGSTDGSAELCDYYVSNDSRIRCLHIENSGVSAARNFGLSHASGTFVTFIDSDDYVSENFFSNAIYHMNSDEKLDFIQFSIDRFNDEGVFFVESSIDIKSSLLDFVSTAKFWGSVCASFMKMEIIKQNKLSFNTCLKLGEDQAFLYQYLSFCRVCSKSSEVFYHYRDNQQSATHNPIVKDLLLSIEYFRNADISEIFLEKINATLFSLYFQLVILTDISVERVSDIGKKLDLRFLKPSRKLESCYIFISKFSHYFATLIIRFLSNVIKKR